jgi:hypothetical protein
MEKEVRWGAPLEQLDHGVEELIVFGEVIAAHASKRERGALARVRGIRAWRKWGVGA